MRCWGRDRRLGVGEQRTLAGYGVRIAFAREPTISVSKLNSSNRRRTDFRRGGYRLIAEVHQGRLSGGSVQGKRPERPCTAAARQTRRSAHTRDVATSATRTSGCPGALSGREAMAT